MYFPKFFICCVSACLCSDTGERGGPGEAPGTAVRVSLQGDRTTGDGQDSLSPGLCGPQHCGMAPSASLEQKMSNVIYLIMFIVVSIINTVTFLPFV